MTDKNNMDNEPNFRSEFISFFKFHGYPASGIICNAKMGETHVDYLITVPNSNEKLAIIIVADGIDDSPAQKQLCRQEVGEPICLLTPSKEVRSKYSFILYYLDNNGNFQELNIQNFKPKLPETIKTISSASDEQLDSNETHSKPTSNDNDFMQYSFAFFFIIASLLKLMGGWESDNVVISFFVILLFILFMTSFIALWRFERKKYKARIKSGKNMGNYMGSDGNGSGGEGGCGGSCEGGG